MFPENKPHAARCAHQARTATPRDVCFRSLAITPSFFRVHSSCTPRVSTSASSCRSDRTRTPAVPTESAGPSGGRDLQSTPRIPRLRPSRPTTARSDASLIRLMQQPVVSRPNSARAPSQCERKQGSNETRGRWVPHLLGPPSRRKLPAAPRDPTSAARAAEEAAGAIDEFEHRTSSRLERHRSVAGMRSVANGARDYHLTRRDFHHHILANLNAMQALREVSEAELLPRLGQLHERFGTSRLGRREFQAWISEVVRHEVPRHESDVIFDAFDDNRSEGIDESEFVIGIKSVLHSRDCSLVNYLRRLLGDVRAVAGTLMSEVEVHELLDAIQRVGERKMPDVKQAVAVVLRNVGEFMHQHQVPTAEFCRAIEVSPVISHLLATLQDDATFPPSPSPPPTPDPARDLQRMPSSEQGVPTARLEPSPSLTRAGTFGSVASLESTLRGPPKRKPHKPKPPPVLSKFDTCHPGFRADESMSAGRSQSDVPEHGSPLWFIRNGTVWRRTNELGELPVD